MLTVIKRDFTRAVFDESKLRNAVIAAFSYVGEPSTRATIDNIIASIIYDINAEIHSSSESDTIGIESIQDIVEKVLALYNFKVAKHYISYRIERSEFRKRNGFKVKGDYVTPFGEIGYITYKRTYARRLSDHGETEEFGDTVRRVLSACQRQLNIDFTSEELEKGYKYMTLLKGLVGGRFLWQLGSKTIDDLGLMSLQNCAFCVIDAPIRPFTWIFNSLMLGVGVGCSIQYKHVSKLPHLKEGVLSVIRKDTHDADYIIPDSREGWVSFLEHVLDAFYNTRTSFTYSTILIRPAGRPIKGFGGVASGPDNLCAGMQYIVDILNGARGRQLKTIECLDIVDIIASIVVSGNVRRSAIIMIGDHDDTEYLNAKRWDTGPIPNWRAMSNNSVDVSDTTLLPESFWDGYLGNGEPYGLVNLNLCRSIGRIKDGSKYADPKVEGFNPCAEIPLAPWETCCLSEIFLPNIDSFDELKSVAEFLYRVCKHSLRLKCHNPETEAIVHSNSKIGIGVTGYLQSTEEQKKWLPDLYDYLRDYDIKYSRMRGFPTSIKLTTVKPSGTLSLLAGVTPGCHPAIFRYFIRRIRVSANNPLVEKCALAGYKLELQRNFDGSPDPNTFVIEFPCRYPDNALLAKDMSAIDQLEVIKRLQTDWSDNAVSCTVYYHKRELSDIREWLTKNYTAGIKSCSFLLHRDHGFAQAPYSEISEQEYLDLKAKTVPLTHNAHEALIVGNDDTLESFECAKGSCPVK